MTPIPSYHGWDFESGGKSRPVYVRGEGPGVIIMHELPGITPELLRFAGWVVGAGFQVFLPHLFGEVGRPVSNGYVAASAVKICVSREFALLATDRPGEIAGWLRALAAHVHTASGSAQVGVVGMCLTGHFALALMTEPCVEASVLAQPSLPLPITARHKAATHVTARELDCAVERCRAGAKVMGLRFTGDRLCPAERFATLRRHLGEGFIAIEIDSIHANPASPVPQPHGVLTTDLVDAEDAPTKRAAMDVIAFLQERLQIDRAGVQDGQDLGVSRVT